MVLRGKKQRPNLSQGYPAARDTPAGLQVSYEPRKREGHRSLQRCSSNAMAEDFRCSRPQLGRAVLASKPLGQGEGPTAAQLTKEGKLPKNLIISHATRSFEVYKAIIKNANSSPNLFILGGAPMREQ